MPKFISLTLSALLLVAVSTTSPKPFPQPEQRGCCSHHNGVCGCQLNHVMCCDSTMSPSCTC